MRKPMISLEKIKLKAEQLWQSQRLQRAYITGESVFPIVFKLPKLSPSTLQRDFSSLRAWAKEISLHSKEFLGYGYQINYKEIIHRQLGQQLLPIEISFENPKDFLQFIDMENDFQKFRQSIDAILAKEPDLKEWLISKTHYVPLFENKWHSLLHVCDFIRNNPQPNCYLREISIQNIDSKYIEQNKKILIELLDQLLPLEQINQDPKPKSAYYFEQRYGFKHDEQLIRFRILGKSIFNHVHDLSVPLSDFKKITLPCKKVYITENKINGLSFPLLEDAMVIFGLGYGIQSLRNIAWLAEKEIIYWGDIDTHGFAMLSQIRGYYPQTKALLMDLETLQKFKHLWVAEPADKQYMGSLNYLTPDEQRLFAGLVNNVWGENVRLEQERISFQFLCEALNK